MKNITLLIITSLTLISFLPNRGFTQCNIQASICTQGTAGPFDFVTTGGNYAGDSYAAGSCDTGSGGFGDDFAFITLNISTSGPLELLIDGNTDNGFLDVIIFNIPDGVSPCDAVLDANNEIACNYATNSDGCVQIGNAFPCNSSIDAPNVTAGDEVMIIVHDYNDANDSFTLDLSDDGAQTGPADATINLVGTTCLDDAPFQLTAANNGGNWSGPGTSADGTFDPSAAGLGIHTINYDVGVDPCDDQDQTTIEVIDCSSCFINYFDANISACISGTGTYEVSGEVNYETPPGTGDLVIEDCFGTQHVIASAPFDNPGSINYTITDLPADGANCSLTTYFTDETACENGPLEYTAPTCPCFFTALSTNISACDPSDNTFEITGTVEFVDPPTTGQLIVEDCNGNQQTFNAPFSSPQDYALTGIDSDGTQDCELNIYFSDNISCEVTSGNFNYPQNCFCETEIGTFTDVVDGSTATNDNPYLLCFGDDIDVTGNGDFVPPQDFNINNITYDPGIWLLVYECPPTIFEPDNLVDDPCLLGVASTNDQAWSIINNSGDNETLYFMPVTMYSMVDGIYAVTLNNGDRCYQTGPIYDVTFLEQITTNIVEDCQAGTANVTINGGLPSLDGSEFTLSNLQPASATLSSNTVENGGTVTISGLEDGDNYSFDIVDGTGCPHAISGTFVGLEDPSFNYTDSIFCQSQNNPSANITGTTGGTFSVAPGGLTIDQNSGLIDLSSATGTFTITYQTPDPVCFDTEDFVITINPDPIINPINNQEVCDEFTFPAITGTDLTGGEAYYTEPDGGGAIFNEGDVVIHGDFANYPVTLYIYDETGTVPNCNDEEQFNLTIYLTPILDPLDDQVACDTYTLPEITGNNLTGNQAYYEGTNGTGTSYNAGDEFTTPGTTTLYIYDETNTNPVCFDETSFTVTINNSPEIDPIDDQVACDTYTLPAITGNNLAGNEAYYEGTNGTGTSYNAGDEFTTPGTTTLYIYDETNTDPICFNEVTFEVTINITPTFTIDYTDPTECALSDGTIIINGLEPNTAYEVSYTSSGTVVGPSNFTSDGNGTVIIDGLAAGSYSDVTITLNDCTTIDNTSVNLVEPNAPPVSAGDDQQVCEGTLVTLTADNPENASISWDNGVVDGESFNAPVGNTTFTVTAELDGCTSSDQVIITVYPLPVINEINDQEECDLYTLPDITGTNLTGNEAYYDAIGGTGNTFNSGDVINTSGTNTLYIYDETGTNPNCFDETSFDVTINLTPDIDELADQEECDSYILPAITGTNLTGNEAYYDAINGGGNVYNEGDVITTAGQNTLYIYDETNTDPICFDETSFVVTINLTPEIEPIADQEECDTYILPAITGTNMTGNESYYDVANGAGNSFNAGHNVTTPGNSTFYIFDETGTTPNCFDETSFVVTINVTPEIEPITDETVCDEFFFGVINGANLTGNEAFYTQTDGNGTQYNTGDIFTTPGTTTFYAYDETNTTPNCSDEVSFEVTVNITPNFTLSSSNPTECSLDDGYITISDLVSGETYQITYTDGGTVVGPLDITADANGDAVITGLTAGTYSDFIVSLNDCAASDNAVINLVDPNAPFVDAGPDIEVCEDEEIILTANNPDGADITWNNGVSDGQPFTQNVGTMTYTVTANLSNCISTDQTTVTVHPNPDVNAGNDVIICENESVILSGSGADTYEWDNGITNGVAFTPTETQTYTVIGTSIHGCTGTDQVIVEVDPLPTVSFEADNLQGCIPVTTTFTNTSNTGDECTWYLGDGTVVTGCEGFTHTYNNVGCFTVTLEVKTENGCTTTETYNNYICVEDYPIADFSYTPQNPTSIFSEVEFINNSLGATQYEWTFGDGNTSNQENPSNDYGNNPEDYNVMLVAISPFGCADTALSTIRVIEDLIYYVPNTFTPDNNGVNEIFKPVFTSGFNPLSYKLLIFNRWGEVLFESYDSDIGWDGTYGADNDQVVKDGTYVWKIEFRRKDNDERIMRVGHVNVLR